MCSCTSPGARAAMLVRPLRNERGQASVEAAFLLPVLLVVIGLMLEPSILFYNRCVMCNAAAEGCRMLETNSSDEQSAKAFVARRLRAVPNVDVFHCGGSKWNVELVDSGGTGEVEVEITNKVRPLPLLGVAAGLLAARCDDGTVEQHVRAKGRIWPAWASASGATPDGLAGEWE